jgi:DEAD/DEAH box helicase domain-containing protein
MPKTRANRTQRPVIETVSSTLAAHDGLNILYDPVAEEPKRGSFRDVSESTLHPAVIGYLEKHHPRGLFNHQHEAVEGVLQGRNMVVATRTSSGKSLIYSLPSMDAICRSPGATALLLYPQKALANDQLVKLQDMIQRILPVQALAATKPLLASRYDGSTPNPLKPAIRQDVQILITNPDMLHLGILQHHHRHWARFFAGLQLVAIDECHEYRGVFGTNVAYILHRLRQVCAQHESNPRFVATSATVCDPQGHLERLTGVPFECVGPEGDGSLQGQRKFWMVGSREHYYDAGRKIASALADAGLTVLAFCPSRTSAERMIARLPKSELASDSSFRVYRSGLSAEEREEIEQGLRDRSVRVVFSTSALELGIDIGQIDVTLCIGLPPTMMSLWQRAGRSARGGRDGATILLPADTPIDTHYAQHPQEFFGRDQEPLVLNLSNRRLVCQHYACAVHEMGGDEDRLLPQIVGPEMARVQELRRQGKVNREEFYRADPHAEVSIRSAGEGAYSLVWENNEIGEIDSFHLLREAYIGAIYRHGGRKFRVRDVIRGRRQVRLRSEFSRNETQPFIQKKIRLKHQYATAEYPSLRLAHVSLDVTEFLVAVTEKDVSGKTVRSWQGSQGMPPHRLPTEGSMLLLRPPLWSRLAVDLGEKTFGALQAAQRLVGSLFPTICGPCDVQDFSSGIERLPTGEYAVFLYDMVYDGVGLTKTAFEHFEVLVENCLQRLDSCACPGDEGCFCCIANPRVDDPVSKRATRILLQTIHDVLRGETPAYTRSERDWSDDLQTDSTLVCRKCGTTLPAEARFCSNCGEKQEVSTSDVADA